MKTPVCLVSKSRISQVLILSLLLLGVAGAALAGDKEDVAVAAKKWETAFAIDNPDAIVPLYDKEAVLWGTLSAKRRDDPAAIRDYFVGAYKALPKHTVAFGDQLIRVYGNVAINTGYYTVSYVKNGQSTSIPARYSFTYVKRGKDWLIVDHHSSGMPAPAK